ncbi:anti-sigma factor [Subtercola boreus]|uniref:Anti-sigma K factor RskA C-terminal domain-containing protein n=1 Tax=Subtercola boreus TaxID=120213 RepID=A0A3E0W804_9MICO|nr:anti-sigma factor [Subtercola boreus]RFA17957.1 hypothetical protein B7R24_14935 [Subtercola boreus]RFA18339.1 hypothetical protein B7R23_14970 [Subtercola boreus]RFA24869.1 hypothetical protein B7R25_14965 [Subtercola boreus]
MHTDPDILALLALGEPAGSDDDRAHIASCPGCTSTLAAFTGAAAAGRSTASVPALVAPHERVWNQIAAAVGADATPEVSSAERRERGRGVRGRSVRGRSVRGRSVRGRSVRGRRLPVRWLALAAAVVLAAAAGGVTTSFLLRPTDAPGGAPSVTVLARAALTALPDWPGATGDAVVESNGADTSMVISVNAATDRPDAYREVWLLSADLTKLVSLGLLSGDSGTFAIPTDIDMSQYSIVDVSSEPLDGNPAHSSNSIVRGSFDS